MKKVVVILVGIVLLAGVIFTGTYGVSQKNIEVYERAMEMQSIADTIGWADFRIADYPIAVYDGENEYVFTRNKGGYDVNKRAVTMNFLVATAYPVDDHFEVITPDLIYDYFEPLFKKEVYGGSIHETYILTELILEKLSDESLEKKIVKTLYLLGSTLSSSAFQRLCTVSTRP